MDDFYTKCPNIFIFGLADLSNNDMMIMLSLIYLAWGEEKPLQISMRDLANLNHVSASVLCDSAKSEEEKQKQIELGKFREGSLTRLSKLGYITVEEEGGKTYITVHLQKIWDDNAEFRKSKGVPNSNTIKSKGVRKSNASVLNSNSETPSSVLESNTAVLNSNTSGSENGSTGGSSDPLRTNNNFNERMKERELATARTSIPSSTLSTDCLEKVSEFAALYGFEGNDDLYHELARRIYQQYVISDDDFYSYLIEAYAASSKTKRMTVFFEKLQEMLEGSFKKREEQQ